MSGRRFDLFLYLAIIAVMTSLSHISPHDSLTDVSLATLVIPGLLLLDAWRGSEASAGISAGFHWIFAGLFLGSALAGMHASVTSQFMDLMRKTRTSPDLEVAYGLLNVVGGALMVRLAPSHGSTTARAEAALAGSTD